MHILLWTGETEGVVKNDIFQLLSLFTCPQKRNVMYSQGAVCVETSGDEVESEWVALKHLSLISLT